MYDETKSVSSQAKAYLMKKSVGFTFSAAFLAEESGLPAGQCSAFLSKIASDGYLDRVRNGNGNNFRLIKSVEDIKVRLTAPKSAGRQRSEVPKVIDRVSWKDKLLKTMTEIETLLEGPIDLKSVSTADLINELYRREKLKL